MTDKIDSFKHQKETRAHIPSKEEAGYEDANLQVQQGKRSLELPVNPVVTRGQDPELFWMNKYGNDDREDLLRVDIRSLYRHEHIAPETIIKSLYRVVEDESGQGDLFSSVNDLFGNALSRDELEKVSEYYDHHDGWTNRLIQGDSHLVMASLLEREGMAGKVQMIYIDPPYGIKYGSNWQVKLNNRDVKDGSDDHLTGEPEVIKAFRDTWELGIHSYLSYIRDRLLIAKELLTESGSCFVQISDENVHLVRNVMDEVFGSENFVSQITYSTTSGFLAKTLSRACDYLIWYAKSVDRVKYRELFSVKNNPIGVENSKYDQLELIEGVRRALTRDEKLGVSQIPNGSKIFRFDNVLSQGFGGESKRFFAWNDRMYDCGLTNHWKASIPDGMNRLAEKNRLAETSNGKLAYIRYFEDFPVERSSNVWTDIGGTVQSRSDSKVYVVQTGTAIVQRCILMTTDPGDLVLDPTCGSGTTAFVAEQFGRRWITTDTSRIALNIAKNRLMTASFPYYHLYSNVKVDYEPDKNAKLKAKISELSIAEQTNDVRQGFVYEKVPHITLKSLANDEPPDTETLFDRPYEDKKKMRVCGPFTVETLQNFEPVSPDEIEDEIMVNGEVFEKVLVDHLLATGIKNGRTEQRAEFTSIKLLTGDRKGYLHAEGFYMNGTGEKKAYFHFGPKFGTVSKKAVTEAVVDCRARGDAKWLIILGFSFESDIEGGTQTTSLGNFEVTRVRIHDDLLQEGLKKKPAKSAASFVSIGEPDIILTEDEESDPPVEIQSGTKRIGDGVCVQVRGLDIYDPIKDEVKARDLHDIAYWMVDENYDGSNFVVKQVFFCGGDQKEFEKWKKGLDTLAQDKTRLRAERTLRIEIDDEAFARVYGYRSHPIEIKKPGQKIAVRVISQYGEESTKVLTV